jgi:SAM-dependent methyltransferase
MQLRQRDGSFNGAPRDESAASRLARLLQTEKASTCGEQSRFSYGEFHKARFADIVRICRNHVPDPSARVLDIGRSDLTAHLHGFYHNLHTLGLDLSADDGGHRELCRLDSVPHITFNLLDSQIPSQWPQCGRFDLIVFSEVIEHLAVAPEYVFACLGSRLSDDGTLVCTTPNAADIVKRVKLALGTNPYEQIRLYRTNPGHFREYTRREIVEIADRVGLHCKCHFYFNWGDGNSNLLKIAVLKLIRAYPPFRPFQICVLRRKNGRLTCGVASG